MSDDETANDLQSTFLENMANRQRFVSGNASDIESDGDVERDPLSDDEQDMAEAPGQNLEPMQQTPALHKIETQNEDIKPRLNVINSNMTMSKEQVFQEKKQCLVEIRQLRSCGAHFSKHYTFEDDLFSIQQGLELARIEITQRAKDGRTKSGVRTARRILMAAVSVLEFATKKWNPLKLQMDGFGEYVMSNIDDYDNVFERLLEKYSGKGTMEPELELVIMLGTSAVMFHVSNKFVNNAMGNVNTKDIAEESRFED